MSSIPNFVLPGYHVIGYDHINLPTNQHAIYSTRPNLLSFAESDSENHPSTSITELVTATTPRPITSMILGEPKKPSRFTLRLLARPLLRLRTRPTTTTTAASTTSSTARPQRPFRGRKCDVLLRRMRRASRSKNFKPLRRERMKRSAHSYSNTIFRCLAENFEEYATKRG